MSRPRKPELITKLRQTIELIEGGYSVRAACQRVGIKPPTYYRLCRQYGVDPAQVKPGLEIGADNGQN